MNSQKTRQHKFVEKFPVVAAILMAIFWMFLFELIEIAINLGIHMVISGYDAATGPVGLFAGTAIMLILYKWWFRPEFEGMLKGDLPLGFLLGLIELGYVLISYVPNLIDGSFSIKPLVWTIILVSLTAGIKEELIFRGVIISTLMRQWKDRNLFRQAALVSGIVFGLIHAANIFAGSDPLQTLMQVLASVCVGFMFAAVYLRTGSILTCMFYHVLHDIIAISCESNVSVNGLVAARAFWWGDVFNLAMAAVMAVAAFWLLRDAKTEQIREVWNRKWKLEAAPAPAPAAVAPAQTMQSKDM